MNPVSSLVRTRIIQDVDAMAAAIADGLQAEYVQLEAKPFSGSWTIVTLPNLVLQFVREDVAVVRRIRVPAGRWAFVVPLAVPESARWNARPVNGNEVIVCGPRSELYACDPAGTMFAIVSVAKSSASGALGAAFLKGSPSGCTVVPRGRDARELQQRLTAIADRAAMSQAINAQSARIGIGSALDLCLRNAMPGERQVEAAVCRSGIVRRAEEFFKCHVGEPVSIAQLSSVSGVSERSLRNAFYDVCTTSPKRYLRLLQLHQVRRALRAPKDAATVTDVATLHGFFELGRFAGEYKALFGEVPSQTLQRARIRQDAPDSFNAA
jgi:AraC family transcriptional regulator, ethanolamine operon transcriptional activator